MIEKYLSAQQIWFTNRTRHWSPASEQYTGADSLTTALRHGWSIDPLVYQRDFLHGGWRPTVVFTFTLHRKTEMRRMAIISTPLIVRLLAEQTFTVLLQDDEVVKNIEEPVLIDGSVVYASEFS